jgi:hypothetical protein
MEFAESAERGDIRVLKRFISIDLAAGPGTWSKSPADIAAT